MNYTPLVIRYKAFVAHFCQRILHELTPLHKSIHFPRCVQAKPPQLLNLPVQFQIAAFGIADFFFGQHLLQGLSEGFGIGLGKVVGELFGRHTGAVG